MIFAALCLIFLDTVTFWIPDEEDDEEENIEVDGVFCYRPGGLPDQEVKFWGDELEEEDAAISAREDSGQPVPPRLRDKADGEY